MNSIPKLIRRFIGILILSVFLLLFLNLALLVFAAGRQLKSQGGWTTADTISAGLTKQADGPYVLDASAAAQLKTDNAWAVLIDGQTLQVTWHSDFLPKEIPSSYSVADIAYLSRAYLRDYPTATSSHPDGLLVVGFPKDRFWKLVHNTYDYQLIADFPKTALLFICMNFLLMFLIYMAVTTRLLGTVKPIIEGIKESPRRSACICQGIRSVFGNSPGSQPHLGKTADAGNSAAKTGAGKGKLDRRCFPRHPHAAFYDYGICRTTGRVSYGA